MRDERVRLINELQDRRDSRVIVYFCGDRTGAASQIGDDAVRPMYEHLLAFGDEKVPKIDLFLYSRGGVVDVPWRIVSMIREFGERWGALVPYRAQSAATLITLGADEIVLGRKGELGPIDPIMNLTDPAGNEAPINVEDIMAYLEFIRKRAGLSDQASLTAALAALAEKIPPVALGGIHRAHSHIRAVAQKMLSSHAQPMEDQKQNAVIETLAERTYAHGHAIGRREARDIGLPIAQHDQEVERLMWDLYRQYEDVMKLNEPIEPFAFLGDEESRREPVIAAAVESEWGLHEYGGEVELEAKRALPAQLGFNLNFNLGLPANINPQQLDQQAQQILQQLVQQVQQQVGPQVEQEIRRQMPLEGFNHRLIGTSWKQVAP